MKMELAKEIKEQNPWIVLTHQSEEKFLIKRKKKVCVNEKTDYEYLNITTVQILYLLQFDSILSSGSIFSSIILKQVSKAHNQIVSFSRTLTGISNRAKPLRR